MNTPEMTHIPRYTHICLPEIKFIPGKTNNIINPSIQSHIPEISEPSIEFTAQNWMQSERYLYGIDLFNYGYYWETHEVWEKIWLKLGRPSLTGIFIQGMIQLSVALLKKINSTHHGADLLKSKAIPKILSQKDIFLGIDIKNIVEQFNDFMDDYSASLPIIKLHFI